MRHHTRTAVAWDYCAPRLVFLVDFLVIPLRNADGIFINQNATSTILKRLMPVQSPSVPPVNLKRKYFIFYLFHTSQTT